MENYSFALSFIVVELGSNTWATIGLVLLQKCQIRHNLIKTVERKATFAPGSTNMLLLSKKTGHKTAKYKTQLLEVCIAPIKDNRVQFASRSAFRFSSIQLDGDSIQYGMAQLERQADAMSFSSFNATTKLVSTVNVPFASKIYFTNKTIQYVSQNIFTWKELTLFDSMHSRLLDQK